LAIIGAMALASPVRAEVVDLDYNIRLDGTLGTCAGTVCATKFGTITVTGNTDSSLTYTVNLASGVSFYGNSGTGPVFYFDLTDPGGGPITFSGLGVNGTIGSESYSYNTPVSGTFTPNAGYFPGTYNYEVTCTNDTAGNICNGPLTFVANGASSADPFVIGYPYGLGVFASYDVPFVFNLSVAPGTAGLCSGETACTGVVGAPESSTWAMMLIGFAGLGFVGYRRTIKASRKRSESPLHPPVKRALVAEKRQPAPSPDHPDHFSIRGIYSHSRAQEWGSIGNDS